MPKSAHRVWQQDHSCRGKSLSISGFHILHIALQPDMALNTSIDCILSGSVVMRAFGRCAMLLALVVLQGCSESQWNNRYGPAPVPDVGPVAAAVQREYLVVQALAQGAGIYDAFPPAPTAYEDWYKIILTGFNTVDDACIAYIDDLWRFERQKTRATGILSATGAAVAAIIGAQANPSAQALTILAQAFNLGTQLTTTIADSYLYTQTPSTIKSLVKKLTDAYRDDLGRKFQERSQERRNTSYPLTSVPAVYYHVREYLSFCLPPTIQGQIDELLARAKAIPEQPKAVLERPSAAGAAFRTYPSQRSSTSIELR